MVLFGGDSIVKCMAIHKRWFTGTGKKESSDSCLRVYSHVPLTSPFSLLFKNGLNAFVWCCSHTALKQAEQDSPPVWPQEAYRPRHYFPWAKFLERVGEGGLHYRASVPAVQGPAPPTIMVRASLWRDWQTGVKTLHSAFIGMSSVKIKKVSNKTITVHVNRLLPTIR